MKYLFKDVTVLSMNESMEIIKSCDVLVKDDIIKAIGSIAPNDIEGATVIAGKGKLLMPGLINGHCHVPMTILRNYADDLDLQTWLFEHIFPVEAKLVGDDVYWGSLLGIMEMLKTGTTCFIDMYDHIEDIAKAVDNSGIRAHLSRGMTNLDEGPDFQSNPALLENIEFIKKWNGAASGRITGAFAPHAIYTCSSNFIKAIKKEAEKLGAPIHVHLDETRGEHEDCLKNHGRTPTKYLYDLGLFEQKTIAAHCVWLTDEDLEILKENNVTMVHNPTSNLKLASGIAPVPKAIEKGVNVILGTDGASSNNNLNLIEEINLAALIHKGVNQNPLLVSAKDCLKMATVNGAKALDRNDIGVIKEGAKADLVLIDLDKSHLLPMHNIVSALAYSVQGSDVCLTMVDGKILYENGEFKTIDKEQVKFNIEKSFKRLF